MALTHFHSTRVVRGLGCAFFYLSIYLSIYLSGLLFEFAGSKRIANLLVARQMSDGAGS